MHAALARDPDKEMTEGVIELLNVRQHSHAERVPGHGAAVHAVAGEPRHWIGTQAVMEQRPINED